MIFWTQNNRSLELEKSKDPNYPYVKSCLNYCNLNNMTPRQYPGIYYGADSEDVYSDYKTSGCHALLKYNINQMLESVEKLKKIR